MNKFKLKQAIIALSVVVSSFSITSCSSDNTIIIGTMSQPGEPILKEIQGKLEEKGYNLEYRIFTDFNTPNIALSEGSIDANLFQHEPFLNNYNTANQTDLFCAAKLYDCAYAGYSKKNVTLSSIPSNSTISIANDNSNMKRCLKLLEQENLITLNPLPTTLAASDITTYIATNPYCLTIRPMATNMIAESLNDEDVSIGIVNATFAIVAGLSSEQIVFQEQDLNHDNANILAIRKEDKKEQWVSDLVSVLTEDDTRDYINTHFLGTLSAYFESRI